MYVVNRTRGTYIGVNVHVANSFRSRLLGLHAHRNFRFGDGVWLVPCNSIQTMGMRASIDAVFLDAGSRVVFVVEHVQPGQVIWRVRDAHSVLELPAGVIRSSETRVGDLLEFVREASLDQEGSGEAGQPAPASSPTGGSSRGPDG